MENFDDPFLWLEEVQGERALEWVRAQNERSLAKLETNPRFQSLYEQALALVHAKDKIPGVGFVTGDVMGNFWQDEQYVRGIFRETTLDSYRTDTPEWKTILDIDEIAAADNINWVFKGAGFLMPEQRHGIIALSDGGKDAVVLREFDKAEGKFVQNGFNAPEGQQVFCWLDQDTLLITRDWGPGTMTKSGKPYITKRWSRGQTLDEAVEIFRGSPDDLGAGVGVLRSDDFTRIDGIIATRSLSFFERERYLLSEGKWKPLPLPKKYSTVNYLKGQMVFTIDEPWPEQNLLAGDLEAFSFQTLKDSGKLESQLIFRPNEYQSLGGISSTRDYLVFDIMDNVMSEIKVAAFAAGNWSVTTLVPRNGSMGVSTSSMENNRIIIGSHDFLNPGNTTLVDIEKENSKFEILKSYPSRFDSSTMVSKQLEAISRDGTRIPYFVVRPKNLEFDGSAPTLMSAYGGFGTSMTPGYVGMVGKLWIEKGGVYVVPNLRGGGEFGPSWHQAALKEKRQNSFDDLFAVSEDLINRGITSPRRLGITGGSNGGLLMGVALTQRPDLFGAIAIHVPLLDMVRYTVMGGAGASWIGEYGDPEIPAERAFIEKYSPYQNLREGQPYPEVLITTSTKDDRVVPGHARKMAARLNELGYPVLYHEKIDGGHGGATNLNESAYNAALEYAYFFRALIDAAEPEPQVLNRLLTRPLSDAPKKKAGLGS